MLKVFSYNDLKVGFGQDSLIKNDLFHVLRLFAIVSFTHIREKLKCMKKDDF